MTFGGPVCYDQNSEPLAEPECADFVSVEAQKDYDSL